MANDISNSAIIRLDSEIEERIDRNPLLNIDTFVIPSPYVAEENLSKDYTHSFAWSEEGELLGYVLAYSNPEYNSFLIYRLVTSPFGRGRGIGTALAKHLISSIPPDARVYLYLWEKQSDTIEFFLNFGFVLGETIVYRNLVYYHVSGIAHQLLIARERSEATRESMPEEIGKTRHDARKTIRLLSNMVDVLSIENCGRIIEDINRESTSLVNTLNAFRDSMSREHEVNISELVLERIVPYVGASRVKCELRLKLQSANVVVLGNYVTFSRALVNIVSNALDAIAESQRDGIIEIKIGEENGDPYVRIRDNGIGMTSDQLKVTEEGVPAFVGKTSKAERAGEGVGTRQIFGAFGRENIAVDARENRGTTWRISFRKPTHRMDKWFVRLERRYHEFSTLTEVQPIGVNTPYREIVSFVWQTRKIEIFLYDVVLHFSSHHNIRNLFRTILSFLMGDLTTLAIRAEIESLRTDRPALKEWLIETVLAIRTRWEALAEVSSQPRVRDALFKSYGQAIENVMIFTLNPDSGDFLATDRKLAEHLDFAPYLGAEKERLLRGEFIGDINNLSQPLYLGVWSVRSESDLRHKLGLIQRGVSKLIEIGVVPEKALAFYQTTHVHHEREIDSDAITTCGEFAALSGEGLLRFTRSTESELRGYILGRE